MARMFTSGQSDCKRMGRDACCVQGKGQRLSGVARCGGAMTKTCDADDSHVCVSLKSVHVCLRREATLTAVREADGMQSRLVLASVGSGSQER